jgi:hypothetical protein
MGGARPGGIAVLAGPSSPLLKAGAIAHFPAINYIPTAHFVKGASVPISAIGSAISCFN